ncbi:MAG TPA: D-alanyl-D-alanine carboxypeptidase/D-alanyl-D-alanine-endopeptidase [Oligoflexia bacterium]|nr:D-alanyl-D-alanine carboxypeptidase/D-alanyl-D-alanine-endopeptidase [Oligoflexia bacterium]HMP27575.1 D-alanyl-D-alanine carboxypeptidase/D-alanyl-D-alanine-endopeptidase [Oligoflexia bacterium]
MSEPRLLLSFFFALLFFVCGGWLELASADQSRLRLLDEIRFAIDRYTKLKDGAKELAIIIGEAQNREPIFQYGNLNKPLKPASTLKVLTSYATLKKRGAASTLKTFIEHNRQEDTLILRGEPDPTFTSERVFMLARQIAARGIKQVKKIVLDLSNLSGYVAKPSGGRAYQGAIGNFALNYGAVKIDLCPEPSTNRVLIGIEPRETFLQIVGKIDLVKTAKFAYEVGQIEETNPWRLKVSGSLGQNSSCFEVYRSAPNPAKLFCDFFSTRLVAEGVALVGSKCLIGNYPDLTGTSVLLSYSKPLAEIVRDMNIYSSNFIADMLVLGVGDDGQRRNFNFQEGLNQIKQFALANTAFPEDALLLVDGSGLSHDNGIYPLLLFETLKRVAVDPDLGVEFLSSLPRSAESGTLKSRKFKKAGGAFRGKTGRINGVSALAGIVKGNNRDLFLLILQNGVNNEAVAHKFEETIVDRLVGID